MQADTSPEQQKRIISEWAINNSYDIVRWYEDAGKSGTSFDKRPAFVQLKHDAHNRRDFQSIIVLDESRWGRAGAKESIFYKMYFEKLANVEVRLVRGSPFEGGKVLATYRLDDRHNSTYLSESLPNIGDSPLYIMVDPDNHLPEGNEGNNIAVALPK